MTKGNKRRSNIPAAIPAVAAPPPAPPAAAHPSSLAPPLPHDLASPSRLVGSPPAIRVLAFLAAMAALYAARPVLLPFTVAMILSIALGPVFRWLVRHGLSRTMSGAFLAILALVLLLGIAAVLVAEIGQIVRDRRKYIDALDQKVKKTVERLNLQSVVVPATTADADLEGFDAPPKTAPKQPSQQLAEWVRRSIEGNTREAWVWATAGFGTLAEFLALVVLTIGYLFFMLRDLDLWGARFLRAARALGWRMGPADLKLIEADSINILAWRALINATYVPLTSIGLWLLHVPQPWLWGLLTGLFSFIPYFGVIISIIFPILISLATSQGWLQPVGVVVLYTLLHVAEGHFVYPWLIGSRVQINPVLALLVTILWGWLWGPLGFLLGLSILVLVRDIVRVCPDASALAALLGVDEPAGTEHAS